jgi:hypothetical protein
MYQPFIQLSLVGDAAKVHFMFLNPIIEQIENNAKGRGMELKGVVRCFSGFAA